MASENDLLPLGQRMAPGAALLSPRGKVSENGMPRFFRRVAEGVFDVEASTGGRTNSRTSSRRRAPPMASRRRSRLASPSGANIAWSTLLRHPRRIERRGAGSRGTAVRCTGTEAPAGTPVLLLSGAADPMVPAEQRERLALTLKGAGALLTSEMLPAGHNRRRRIWRSCSAGDEFTN